MSLLLCGSAAIANAAEVEVVQYQASGRNVRLTLKSNGKGTADVKISVLTADDQLLCSLSSRDRTVVFLPPLAPGKYHIAASDKSDLRADLYLIVSAKAGDKPNEFMMQLTVKSPPPPSFEELLSIAEKLPASETLGKFVGTVRDPSGASVRGCQVQIFEKGFRDKQHTVNLISDDQGHFSATLADGNYTAVFSIAGFRIRLLHFEILPEGNRKEVTVRLELGAST
jgi:hypothetical protein